MNKEDFKAIVVIIIMALIISAMVLFGINMYMQVFRVDEVQEEVLFQGNTSIDIDNNIANNLSTDSQGGNLNQIASAGNQTQATQPSISTENEGYYYNQLNSYEKIIYNGLKNNKENLKSGTYQINFGKAFNELLAEENGTELLQQYYQSGIESYLYDNPDVFYLDPTKMYINIQTTKKLFNSTYEVFIDSGENANYLSKTYSSKEQILEYENQINKEVVNILSETEGKSDYQKILIIHDYLVDNVTYDETVSKNNIYNMYGALVNKEAVCEGYAKAFQYLMQQIGIESVIIIGSATDSDENIQNHAWNYVKLNNTWYAVDVTWDDPVLIGGGILTKRYRYKYFLKGSETMSKDHVESYTFVDDGKVYTLPTLSVTDY